MQQFGTDQQPIEQPDVTQAETQAVETLPEETEEVSEETAKRKKHTSAKQRINQIQREKYQAIEEANRLAAERQMLAQENEQLRRLAEASTSNALTQYESGVLERLERAKEQKAQSIEAGDVKAQVDADIALSAAIHEYQQISLSREQQKIRQQDDMARAQQYEEQMIAQQRMMQNASPDVINRYEAERWVQDNDWFKQDSPNYNPQLANTVNLLCDQVDALLYRTGQQNKIFSKEYFDYIDQNVTQWQQSTSGKLNMRPSREGIAPVRNGMGSPYQERREVRLTQEEKDLARRSGVTPEVFLQYKLADQQRRGGR